MKINKKTSGGRHTRLCGSTVIIYIITGDGICLFWLIRCVAKNQNANVLKRRRKATAVPIKFMVA